MVKQREIWVDNVKILACFLVVLGHFFQSMVQANIINESNLYQWFIQTVYYFHVPLFFICSGYLYQKLTKMNSFQDWGHNIIKKLVNLGVPYFSFSFITWAMKKVFSGSINNQIGGILDTLFIHLTSAYWYLYALFFIFLITPIIKSKFQLCVIFIFALTVKVISITGICGEVRAISYVCSNEIWFILGMVIAFFDFPTIVKKIKKIHIFSIVGCFVFLILSVIVYREGISFNFIPFLLGLLACVSIVTFVIYFFQDNKQNFFLEIIAKYTMPIFLMHTIFAAGTRVVLVKMNISNVFIHISLGLCVSFIGPIISAIIMHKSKYLEFFINPSVLSKR